MGTKANWFFSIAIFWFLMSPISTAQAPKSTSQKSRLQYAAQAISAGKLEEAESELQSVLRLTPDEFHALDLLGVIRIYTKVPGKPADRTRPLTVPAGDRHIRLIVLPLAIDVGRLNKSNLPLTFRASVALS